MFCYTPGNTNDKRLGFGSFYLPRWRIFWNKNKWRLFWTFCCHITWIARYSTLFRTNHGGKLPRATGISSHYILGAVKLEDTLNNVFINWAENHRWSLQRGLNSSRSWDTGTLEARIRTPLHSWVFACVLLFVFIIKALQWSDCPIQEPLPLVWIRIYHQ